jgi:hypothetical protein
MSYVRVIPRDLFNEASLLKCYGRIYTNLETAGVQDAGLEHDGEAFDIQQDEDDGSTHVANVKLMVRGEVCRLFRPMNSRGTWPLYFVDDNEEELEVFAEDGSFSRELVDFLRGP